MCREATWPFGMQGLMEGRTRRGSVAAPVAKKKSRGRTEWQNKAESDGHYQTMTEDDPVAVLTAALKSLVVGVEGVIVCLSPRGKKGQVVTLTVEIRSKARTQYERGLGSCPLRMSVSLSIV